MLSASPGISLKAGSSQSYIPPQTRGQYNFDFQRCFSISIFLYDQIALHIHFFSTWKKIIQSVDTLMNQKAFLFPFFFFLSLLL